MNPFLTIALIFASVPLVLGPLLAYLRWEERRHTDPARIRLPDVDLS